MTPYDYNVRPAFTNLGPSAGYAADRAATDTGMAMDRAQGAEERRMRALGVNPASPRYAGLRQKWALHRGAAVSGAATRAANLAREASFNRLLSMISRGAAGLRGPERALNFGYGGSGTVGRRETGGGGGDYASRVQSILGALRGQPVAPMSGGSGVQRIGEMRPGVIGLSPLPKPRVAPAVGFAVPIEPPPAPVATVGVLQRAYNPPEDATLPITQEEPYKRSWDADYADELTD